jgi:MEDS: MEthanogen/methylotroph, DcmR Sensory domain
MTPNETIGPGVAITPGDHVCAFYRGREQRDEVLLPFLHDGILAGDKCICVLDDPDVEQVAKPLSLVVDLDAPLRTGQVDLLTTDEAYLPDGTFGMDRMLEFWDKRIGHAVDQGGYPFVRAVGEMTWALRGLPGSQDLTRYEARLNRLLPRCQVILCLYDLERFTDGHVLMELLRTHPKVLMSGQLLENPWYVDPDDANAAA